MSVRTSTLPPLEAALLAFLLLFAAPSVSRSDDEYRLGPGDGLRIDVVGYDDLTAQVTVRPDGRITFVPLGELFVRGKTPLQLADEIKEGLKKYLVEADIVTVTLTQFRPRQLRILGEVRSPGSLDLMTAPTLADAIAAAGGPTENARADAVTILRDDAEPITADIVKAMVSKRADENIPLREGDIIIVPSFAVGELAVLGAVGREGLYQTTGTMTLAEALRQAGGTAANADISRVSIRRGGKIATVNLRQGTGGAEASPLVQAGDIISVPEIEPITVLGEMRGQVQPDKAEGIPLSELLASASGAAATADLSRITISTADGVRTIDARPVFRNGELSEDVLVPPGSLVVVPKTRRQVMISGEVQRPGIYEYREGDRVADALKAVGIKEDTADPAGAKLIRASGETLDLDLEGMMREGDMTDNYALQPDDVILIPRLEIQITVLGAGQRSGPLALPAGSRVLDAVEKATITSGRLKRVVIIRPDRKANTAEAMYVSIKAMLQKGDLRKNVELMDGDILYIPPARPAGPKWDLRRIFSL
ncbi:MAG: SLBB domain-containing protein, partial [Armatimonadota bacterium]